MIMNIYGKCFIALILAVILIKKTSHPFIGNIHHPPIFHIHTTTAHTAHIGTTFPTRAASPAHSRHLTIRQRLVHAAQRLGCVIQPALPGRKALYGFVREAGCSILHAILLGIATSFSQGSDTKFNIENIILTSISSYIFVTTSFTTPPSDTTPSAPSTTALDPELIRHNLDNESFSLESVIQRPERIAYIPFRHTSAPLHRPPDLEQGLTPPLRRQSGP
ncbi:hypothetical protein FPV67DRAFT_1510274 [Lyophyllum atratum]|nr:hypothetical protein FPV67DRAFT_1510274 [Lyophyllum atratum]